MDRKQLKVGFNLKAYIREIVFNMHVFIKLIKLSQLKYCTRFIDVEQPWRAETTPLITFRNHRLLEVP